MSRYTISPKSIVSLIRNNLLDRYDSGYPILKELLQNADDAGAHRFRLDARVGWPDAENPLLRGPGLLIVNDGEFRPKDRKRSLVVGMAGNSLFNELFSGAQGKTGERLTSWFDHATATLGGRDVVDTVREIFGNVARFDFQQVGKALPRVDLGDLERFFTLAAGRHHRRIFKRAEGIELRAPDAWKARSYAVRDKYDGLVFDRRLRGATAASRVLGVGHTLFDAALDEARSLPVRIAALDGLEAPLLIVVVEDEVTGTGSLVRRLIFDVRDAAGEPAPMRDWELLRLLNGIPSKDLAVAPEIETADPELAAIVNRLRDAFASGLPDHAPSLHRPVCWPEMLFVPARSGSSGARTVSGNAVPAPA